MANDIVNYQDVITDIKGIITSGREVAYNAANKAMGRQRASAGPAGKPPSCNRENPSCNPCGEA